MRNKKLMLNLTLLCVLLIVAVSCKKDTSVRPEEKHKAEIMMPILGGSSGNALMN